MRVKQNSSVDIVPANSDQALGYPYDLFLSYSSNDRSLARQMYHRLTEAGLHVWFDETEVAPGAPLGAMLDQGVAQSRHVAVLLSEAALESGWAMLESELALGRDPDGRQQVLLPVLIGEIEVAKVPAWIRTRAGIRLASDDELDHVVAKLVAAARGSVVSAIRPQTSPHEARQQSDRVAAKMGFRLGPIVFEWSFRYAAAGAVALMVFAGAMFSMRGSTSDPVAAMPPLPADAPVVAAGSAMVAPPSEPAIAPPTVADKPDRTPSRPPTPRIGSAHESIAAAAAAHGSATCAGTQCKLQVLAGRLDDKTPRVCLHPANLEDLHGDPARCTLTQPKATSCMRTGPSAGVTLQPPITWSNCP